MQEEDGITHLTSAKTTWLVAFRVLVGAESMTKFGFITHKSSLANNLPHLIHINLWKKMECRSETPDKPLRDRRDPWIPLRFIQASIKLKPVIVWAITSTRTVLG